MDLTNLPEYISAIVAIIALFISCYQARLSNKQSLFNRRLNIWITVDKLMSVYAKKTRRTWNMVTSRKWLSAYYLNC